MKNMRFVWAGILAIASVFCPVAMAQNHFVIYHELDKNGDIIRSIALSNGSYELVSVAVAMLVFVAVVWFIIGGEDT